MFFALLILDCCSYGELDNNNEIIMTSSPTKASRLNILLMIKEPQSAFFVKSLQELLITEYETRSFIPFAVGCLESMT